ncbi:MAG: hypothetical protein Q7S21_04980 [archaeon]|nr:hypothetical protein [archaeon]
MPKKKPIKVPLLYSRKSKIDVYKEIAYTPDFKKFISEHPGIIKEFLKARDKAFAADDYFGRHFAFTKNLSVVRFAKSKMPYGVQHDHLYFVWIGNETFFVKEVRTSKVYNADLGPWQIRVLNKAKQVVESLGEEVIEYKLGFADKYSSFFVSKFYDLPTLLSFYEKDKPGLPENLRKRFERVKAHLQTLGYSRIDKDDCFYDAKRDKLIFFDFWGNFDKGEYEQRRFSKRKEKK